MIIGDAPGTRSDAFRRRSLPERVEPRSKDPFETLHDAIEQGAIESIADDLVAGNIVTAYAKAYATGLTLTLLPSSAGEAVAMAILSVIGLGTAGKISGKTTRFLSGGSARKGGIGLLATRYGTKIEKDMPRRGWTREQVERTISAPHRQARGRDKMAARRNSEQRSRKHPL